LAAAGAAAAGFWLSPQLLKHIMAAAKAEKENERNAKGMAKITIRKSLVRWLSACRTTNLTDMVPAERLPLLQTSTLESTGFPE
jgi:hypothetical protein